MSVAVLQTHAAMQVAVCHHNGFGNAGDLDPGPYEAGVVGDARFVLARKLTVLVTFDRGEDTT